VSAGGGNDVLLGGAGRDYFYFDADQLDKGDVVMGNGGDDTILIRAPGTITAGDMTHVNGIEDFRLVTGGISLAFDDVVAAKNARTIGITGSDGNDTVDASAVTLVWRSFNIAAGAGNDVLKGGAAMDSLHFDIANLDARDTVAGGTGYDALYLTGSGTLDAAALSHVSGIEKIMLLGGAAHLTLGDTIIDAGEPKLYVYGGGGDDVFDAAALTHALVATGGAGDDTIIAGSGGATISGGAGADTIVAGAGVDVIAWDAGDLGQTFDTITGFAAGQDQLQFAASTFHVNGSAFDTVADGGFGTDLADVDLLRTSTGIANADDLLAKLSAGNGTAGQGLFVLAGGGGNGDLMLYYADDASGHGHAYAVADFGAGLASGHLGLGDFVFS
jgi:Ca2+-binding RTX toxin-like protein